MQAGVWKADGLLGAAVVVALAAPAVASYFVLTAEHFGGAVRAALATVALAESTAWT